MHRYPPPAYLDDPGLDGFWDVLKSIPEKVGGIIKKIDPEQVLKAGELVGKFKEGKRKRKDKSGGPGGAPYPSPQPPGLGIDTTTLLLLVGGAGLLVYLLVRRR